MAKLVFVPTPGVGHLKPFVHTANSLSPHFNITVILIPSFSSQWDSLLHSVVAAADSSIRFIKLPQALHHVPQNTKNNKHDVFRFLSLLVQAHKPLVKETIINSVLNADDSAPVVGMFVDAFFTDIIDVAKELNIPPYFFFTSSAAYLGNLLYLPTLHSVHPESMAELDASGVKLKIPSLSNPLPPLKQSEPNHDKTTFSYEYYLRCASNLREAVGIVVNASADVESFAVHAIKSGKCIPDHATPKLYTVGPIVSRPNEVQGGQRHECLNWLDSQPPRSVVYLCFGGMGSFSRELSLDVANSLERSGHRFLWCLRSPPKQTHFMPVDAEIDDMLPEGFLERSRGKGMVWNKWAPQMEILGHVAIGGFVSHCGWNSCLESMWNGVPLLCWPMGAEQRFNAFQMASEIGGVAIDLDLESAVENGSVGEVLEKGLRCLMGDGEEGKKVRKRAEEVKDLCRKSVGELGSSAMALQELVNDLIKSAACNKI